jgi:hypothetical protein
MIRYDLMCGARHRFEAWFRSSGEFDRLALADELRCPFCGSAEVEKALMAPAVSGTRTEGRAVLAEPAEGQSPTTAGPPKPEPQADKLAAAAGDPRLKGMLEEMRRIRREVLESADYVGKRFPEEARKIHYQESEKRGIFGEATAEEVRSLLEEGVEVHPLPVLPEDRN